MRIEWIRIKLHKYAKSIQKIHNFISSTSHYILPKYMWYHHDVVFKLNCWKFAEHVGIKVSYTSGRDLQCPLKIQKNEENNRCILPNQLYRVSHRILSYRMSRDVKEWSAFSYAPLILYKGIRSENIKLIR